MASHTKKTKARRRRRHQKMNRARKTQMSVRSTLTAAELFADCGEPGKPAPVNPAA